MADPSWLSSPSEPTTQEPSWLSNGGQEPDWLKQPQSGSWSDYLFQHTAPGRVISKFGQGASDGWGAAMQTLAPTEEGILKSVPDLWQVYKDNNEQTTKAFNEAFTRPAVWASILKRLEMAPFAGLSAGLGALSEAGVQVGQEFINEAEARKKEQSWSPLHQVIGSISGETGELIQSYASGQNFGELGIPEKIPEAAKAKPQVPEYQGGISDALPRGQLPEEASSVVPEFMQEPMEGAEFSGKRVEQPKQEDYWPSLNVLAESRSKGYIGEGDTGFFNTFPLDEKTVEARTQAAIEAGLPEPVLPRAPLTDPYEIARSIDPELMGKHDLANSKINELRQEKENLLRGTSSFPDLDFVQDQIGRLEGKKKLNSGEQQKLEDLYDFKKNYKKFIQTQDDIEKLDLQLRDMATDVTNLVDYARTLIPDRQVEHQQEWYKAASAYSEQLQKLDEEARNQPLEYSEPIHPLGHEDNIGEYFEKLKKSVEQTTGEETETGGSALQAPRRPVQRPLESAATSTTRSSLRAVEGTGEPKTRGLSKSTEASAIDLELVDEFQGLPEFNSVSKIDQAKLANELIAKDYDRAFDVAMGRRNPPQDLLLTSVYKAVKLKAEKSGDVAILRELAVNSKAPAAVTTMAQNLAMLAGQKFTALDAIRMVQESREAKLKTKAKFAKAIQEVVRQIKEIKKQSNPDIKTWRDYLIKEVACKE